MRVLGVDYGVRRIGLALSDLSATLARPWQTIPAAATPAASAKAVAELIHRDRSSEDDGAAGIGEIVVGLPRKLNGDDTDQTGAVRAFGVKLAALTGLGVAFQDERLSSVEAESRLAVRDKDWRSRKARIDAAAAAVILQDYLDRD
jgi:putative Holliday junction resolvase